MGDACSKTVLQPQELSEFKKVAPANLLQNLEIPERAENRKPTDKNFLYAFIGTVILLFPFLIYALCYADIDRIFGYDNCGNVCGKQNSKYDQWPCTGQDFTGKPYLESERDGNIDHISTSTVRECVEECRNDEYHLAGICVKSSPNNLDHGEYLESYFVHLNEFLIETSWKIVCICLLSLVVSAVVIFLLRKATEAMVWIILITFLIIGAVLVGFVWFAYFNVNANIKYTGDEYKGSTSGILFLAIFLTVFLIVLLCVMFFLRRKIKLVIALIKEAMKATLAMPCIIFTPILTLISILFIVILFLITNAYLLTSGTLTELEDGNLYYIKNAAMIFAAIFNFVVTLWAIQLVVGIQYMVIAGAISKWYFATNKEFLNKPITLSASIVFRFHLGSIAFGSLVITIITLIRMIITSLAKQKALKICMDMFIGAIEQFLKYLSKNSYILTAMHGKPFYKSGKRAARMILSNALNIATINFIGDFVLVMAQLLIVFTTMLLTYAFMQGSDPEYVWAVYTIVFIVSLTIAATLFSTLETTIDTLFLCFCEDSLLNDGMSRPYAMSRNLMEFVENSKTVFEKKQ